MIPLTIILDGKGAWPDLRDKKTIQLSNSSTPMQLAVLERGMASGRPSVAFRLDLPDGESVVAETSARLLCTAARAIMARYPDLFED